MREDLREVSYQPPRDGIVFLAEQAHVIAQGDQSVEHPSCLGSAPHERVDADEPEAASQKRAFAGRQPVDRAGSLCLVASQQAIDQ